MYLVNWDNGASLFHEFLDNTAGATDSYMSLTTTTAEVAVGGDPTSINLANSDPGWHVFAVEHQQQIGSTVVL